ncbi:MAG: hypothetical protein WKF73_22460 [Nocardioidaceae bacterium]
MKLDVVFGENVPPWRQAQATSALAKADAMLVVGSSLMVHSATAMHSLHTASASP